MIEIAGAARPGGFVLGTSEGGELPGGDGPVGFVGLDAERAQRLEPYGLSLAGGWIVTRDLAQVTEDFEQELAAFYSMITARTLPSTDIAEGDAGNRTAPLRAAASATSLGMEMKGEVADA